MLPIPFVWNTDKLKYIIYKTSAVLVLEGNHEERRKEKIRLYLR